MTPPGVKTAMMSTIFSFIDSPLACGGEACPSSALRDAKTPGKEEIHFPEDRSLMSGGYIFNKLSLY
jgi:hypothetical protein